MKLENKHREAKSENTKPERLEALASESSELARIVARNPSTSAALLSILGSHDDAAVRKAVVRNPATPAETAAKLGGQFPRELLDNPAFDFYLFEKPDLLDDVGKGALRSLLKRPSCPESFFAYAARMGEQATQLAVLKNASAPRAVVEGLAQSQYEDVREAACLHLAIAGRDGILDWRPRFDAALARVIDAGGKSRVAHDALAHLILSTAEEDADGGLKLDQAERALLVTARADWSARVAALTDETLDEESGLRLTGPLMAHRASRIVLATRRSTPTWLLKRLAQDDDFVVRLVLLAYNGDRFDDANSIEFSEPTAEDLGVLDLLDVAAKIQIGINLRTPPLVLAHLAKYEDVRVCGAALGNKNIPVGAIELWANDFLDPEFYASWSSREPNNRYDWRRNEAIYSIILNSSTPTDTIQRLAKGIFEEHNVNGWYSYIFRSELNATISETKVPSTILAGYLKDFGYERGCRNEYRLWAASGVYGDEAVRALAAGPSITPPMLRPILARSILALALRPPVTGRPKFDVVELSREADPILRRAAAQHPDADATILRALSEDSDSMVRQAVAKNRSTPADVLESMARSADVSVRHTLMHWRRDLQPSVRRRLLAALPDRDLGYAFHGKFLASDPLTPPDRLEALMVRYPAEVARNPAATAHVLSNLYQYIQNNLDSIIPLPGRRYNIREDVELYRNFPIAHLSLNPKTPNDVLEDISRQHFWNTSKKNGYIEKEFLFYWFYMNYKMRKLLNGKDIIAKEAYQLVSINPGVSSDLRHRIIDRMFHSSSDSDRIFAATNTYTPPELLASLARDQDDGVRRAAAKNSRTPVQSLKTLAREDHWGIRLAAASNPNTPTESLAGLAQDDDADVRRSAASNSNTPVESLAALARDEDVDVRRAAARNKATPKVPLSARRSISVSVKHDVVLEVQSALQADLDGKSSSSASELRVRLVKSLSSQTNSSVSRLLALMLPDAPASSLARAQRSSSWLERCAVATHANTPLSAIEQLSNDGNAVVRSAARARLAQAKTTATS